MKNWSDHALATLAKDCLSREPLVMSLTKLLHSDGLDTPLTIGIYGDWGSGKTSVMRMLKRELEQDRESRTICVWFDAWKFARAEHSLWRALLLAVIDQIGETLPDSQDLSANLAQLRERLFQSLTIQEQGDLKINWSQALPFTLDAGIRMMTAGLGEKLGIDNLVSDLFGDKSEKLSAKDAEKATKLIQRCQSEHYHAQITAIDQFERALSKLIEEKVVNEHKHRLVVFVDDLDRCLPSDAISALEAIKLFFDTDGCLFILGMDRDVVERGILERFPPGSNGENVKLLVDPRKYLDKIVQIPISLPPLTKQQISAFLDNLLDDPNVDVKIKHCQDLIRTAVPQNPRTLKRVLNVLALLVPMHGGGHKDILYLAKVVLLQVLFDEAYQVVRRDPNKLVDLEKVAGGYSDNTDELKELGTLIDNNASNLRALLKQEPMFDDLDREKLNDLIAQLSIIDGVAQAA